MKRKTGIFFNDFSLCYIVVILLTGFLLQATAQQRTLNKERLNQVIQIPTEQLKVTTLENNQLQTIDTVNKDQIAVEPNQMKQIKLGDHVQRVDLPVNESSEDGGDDSGIELGNKGIMDGRFKVIPELYLMTGSDESEDIELYVYFTSEFPLQYNFSQQAFMGSLGFVLLPESNEPVENR